MKNGIEEFKEGIFSLNTRRFGKVAELMIKKLYNMKDSKNLAYDLLTQQNERVEVKFSTVLKKCGVQISEKNVIEQIKSAKLENRMLTFEKIKKEKFDCNIQQVKPSEFKILYYGCFFADRIMICKIKSTELENNKDILYSNHQHRGNTGEGQFHINNKTIDVHLNQYLFQWLEYDELYQLLK